MRLLPITLASLIVVAAVSPSEAASRLRVHKQQSYASQIAESTNQLGSFEIQTIVSEQGMLDQLASNVMRRQNEATRTAIGNIGFGCSPNC